jgi:hypothetical protein
MSRCCGSTGRVLSEVMPELYEGNDFDALATVLEWRAALPRPTSRRRSVGC